LAGQNIDEVKNQRGAAPAGKTVNFKFENESGGEIEEIGNANEPAAPVQPNKWFDKIDEFDINICSSFIGYAMQLLMAVGKWESLVDISNRLNSASENIFASQLLPFIIFAQTTLYEDAATTTEGRRSDLAKRIADFETWKNTNKKKRSR
jgi:hypothetical protein